VHVLRETVWLDKGWVIVIRVIVSWHGAQKIDSEKLHNLLSKLCMLVTLICLKNEPDQKGMWWGFPAEPPPEGARRPQYVYYGAMISCL